ncbi:FAD-binding domain-containing protein [Cognatiyoonia sp. IB215446]|uniref:FAD-binding domain-containing protein n=1 Tax=Cognatiyoonia sp. IB215446 TaxID=3097355 RepID=UPI002A139811|nr:FAD-binding domain-containing protein [Cognatiyoonia sp. IB215446]MDX8347097.1 FAD-binding domain-containing protein [Cognatiyoonia sp. IB215446]
MTSILWFKRDLRVVDHPALAFAAAKGPVLPLYVFEPEYWAEPDVSGRQFAFLSESVVDLGEQLSGIGLTLCVRVGSVCAVLEDLRKTHGVTRLVSHEETGNAWTYARDRAVADWASGQGVTWTELAQSGVIRRLNGRDGWAKARNAFLRQDQAIMPENAEGVIAPSDEVSALIQPDHCPERQFGGRHMALSALGGFLTERGRTYRRDMSSPVTGETACSRLSPYLTLGCLSGREVAQAGAARQREVSGDWAKSLKSFQSRLAWRDHFMQKLEDEPQLEKRCLHSAYERLRGDDRARREAWEKGETGLPFVDACMRYLAATGWLNFRMRSMVMAVASYHLWLDWRQTGLHLARQFTDYEPGIHWPQTQMQSGTTGMNTVRIYNPIKQGWDQDPKGVFTRKWVPELADVPDKYLQEPWRWEKVASLAYPRPIVDVAEAARHASSKIYGVRKGQAFRDEAAKVIDKHASRKDPQGHFVNDRSPRQKRPDPRQRAFDF